MHFLPQLHQMQSTISATIFLAAFILSSSYINLVALPVELLVYSYTMRINRRLYRNCDIWIFLMSVRCLKCTRVHAHSSRSLCYTTITRRPIVDLLDIVSTWFLIQFTILRLLDTMLNYKKTAFKPQGVSRKMSLFVTHTVWILKLSFKRNKLFL